MVGEMSSHEPDDGRDDLAALDFFVADPVDDGDGGSVLDVLDPYPAETEHESADGAPVFTVTNPPGTVTVSTFMDGRVHRIELSGRAAAMPESDLAAEIVVIAGLAAQDARSAQYAVMLEGMREQGHDDATTRDFLTRDLDLPTPEQAQQERARVFATRYAGDHD
ncbi:YbaB/EbfC family DNA-binding protein [Mycolicibacterium flavescens]|uniref:Secretion protein EspD n=1 Tax=Mycolicibacterium flavescens TaxID=1776 RepID=A0A1E3RFE4_MYCFV|nr:secretion protein EspD [Mycolicibacterium flavescens]MCV7278821.1 YbaB/EbfC family DNA-binding protein [Mycolicibacterium flavescens]ODQ88559.1 secretion protein EspD [Mycolicibacterium flavescens]